MSWQKVKLGEVCDSIDYGFTASANVESVGPKFLRITDIQNNSVNWETVPYCPIGAKEAEKKGLKTGDIVFARTGATTGKSFLVRSCPANAVFASYLIRVRPSSKLQPEFLAHFFQTDEYWRHIEKNATGTAQGGVNATILKEMEIPLPPLSEQERIASRLDAADRLRAQRRDALRRLDALTHSLFLDAFGDPAHNPKNWPMVKFDDVLRDETSKSAKLEKGDFQERGRFRIVDQGQKAIAGYSDDESLLNRSTLPVIVFGDHTRAVKYVDFPFVIGADGAKVLCNQPGFDTAYLAHLLRYSAIPNLGYSRHMREVKRLAFIAPPLSLQLEFATRLEQIASLRARMERSALELDALFASLQSAAFGEA